LNKHFLNTWTTTDTALNEQATLRDLIFFATARKNFGILFATAQNTLSFFLQTLKPNPKKNERVFSPPQKGVHDLLKTLVDNICP